MSGDLKLPEISVKEGSIVWDTTGLRDAVLARMEDYPAPVKVTEENYKDVKGTRAELNKMLTAVDTERKSIKAQLLDPVKLWESEVKDVFSPIVEREKAFADAIHAYEQEAGVNQRRKADPIVKALAEEVKEAGESGTEDMDLELHARVPFAVARRLVSSLRMAGFPCKAQVRKVAKDTSSL